MLNPQVFFRGFSNFTPPQADYVEGYMFVHSGTQAHWTYWEPVFLFRLPVVHDRYDVNRLVYVINCIQFNCIYLYNKIITMKLWKVFILLVWKGFPASGPWNDMAKHSGNKTAWRDRDDIRAKIQVSDRWFFIYCTYIPLDIHKLHK